MHSEGDEFTVRVLDLWQLRQITRANGQSGWTGWAVILLVLLGMNGWSAASIASPVFYVRGLKVEGVSGRAVSVRAIRLAEVGLVEVDGVLFSADGDEVLDKVKRDSGITFAMPLNALDRARAKPWTMDASAVRAVAGRVLQVYLDAGYAAVRVDVAQSSVAELQDELGGVLVIRVNEGQVSGVRVLTGKPVLDDETDEADGTDETDQGGASAGLREVDDVNDQGTVTGVLSQRLLRDSPVGVGDAVNLEAVQAFRSAVNRHPARRVDVSLSPGDAGAPGDTEGDLLNPISLDYIVTEGKPWSAFFQISNTGTASTTRIRERFGLAHYNVSNHDDIFTLDYITGGFDDVHAVTGSYSRPFDAMPDLRWRVSGLYSEYDASSLGLGTAPTLRFDGATTSAGGELAWTVAQQDELFIDLVGALRFDRVEANNATAMIQGETNFLLPSLGVRLQRRTREASTFAGLTLETNWVDLANTDAAELQALGRPSVSRNWWALKFNGSHAFYLEPMLMTDWGDATPGSTLAHEVVLSMRGQAVLDDKRVAPSYTQTVGGLYSVRGYNESFASADNVLIVSAEYRFHLPRIFTPMDRLDDEVTTDEPNAMRAGVGAGAGAWGGGEPFFFAPQRTLGRQDWDLIFKTFIDAGWASHNDRQPGETNTALVGAGVGLELSVRHNLRVRVDTGWSLREALNGSNFRDDGENHTHFSVTVSY